MASPFAELAAREFGAVVDLDPPRRQFDRPIAICREA
jgi:hypothetical protein